MTTNRCKLGFEKHMLQVSMVHCNLIKAFASEYDKTRVSHSVHENFISVLRLHSINYTRVVCEVFILIFMRDAQNGNGSC